jgi:hypothetical protein
MSTSSDIISRKYVTGWFSPTHYDVMVRFYLVEGQGPLADFEADVIRGRDVTETLRDSDLGSLQSTVIAKYTSDPH